MNIEHSFPNLHPKYKNNIKVLPVEMQVRHSMNGDLPEFIPHAIALDLVLGVWPHSNQAALVRKENIQWMSMGKYFRKASTGKKRGRPSKRVAKIMEWITNDPDLLMEAIQALKN